MERYERAHPWTFWLTVAVLTIAGAALLYFLFWYLLATLGFLLGVAFCFGHAATPRSTRNTNRNRPAQRARRY